MAAQFRLSGVSLNLKDPFFDYFWSGAFKFGYQSAQDTHFFKVVYSEMKCKGGGGRPHLKPATDAAAAALYTKLHFKNHEILVACSDCSQKSADLTGAAQINNSL